MSHDDPLDGRELSSHAAVVAREALLGGPRLFALGAYASRLRETMAEAWIRR